MNTVVVHLFCCKVTFFVRSNGECNALIVKKIFSKSTNDVVGRIIVDYSKGKQIIDIVTVNSS